jgi:molybdate transport system substrate-binding protein
VPGGSQERPRRRGRRTLTATLVLASALWLAPASIRAADPPVLVFAAASLKDALDQVVPILEREARAGVRVSYAGSPALARQIEAGAPADLFISADRDWMDYLAARDLVQPATEVVLLGNRLVLVAPAERPIALRIAPGFALRQALGTGRLAVADPASVPAGRYARAALEKLGVWEAVADRLAPAENVRVALLFVARGEAPLGIVYATDARVEPRVTVVDTFPAGTHPTIVYPAALTRVARSGASRVLAALRGPAARAVFERQGFLFLAG